MVWVVGLNHFIFVVATIWCFDNCPRYRLHRRKATFCRSGPDGGVKSCITCGRAVTQCKLLYADLQQIQHRIPVANVGVVVDEECLIPRHPQKSNMETWKWLGFQKEISLSGFQVTRFPRWLGTLRNPSSKSLGWKPKAERTFQVGPIGWSTRWTSKS